MINIDLNSEEPYQKLSQMAKLLEVKYESMLFWTKRYDDFPVIRLPGSLRVRPSEVAKWLERFQNEEEVK
jgi:hypothetical protein